MKQDRKEVSSKQKWEPAYVAHRYGISVEVVREVMERLGKGSKSGRPCKSRAKIYKDLESSGYKPVV